MKEFAKRLGFKKEGSFEDNEYIVNLKDSDEYSKVYTMLDNSDLVDIDQDLTVMTDSETQLTFKGDNFDVVLCGNLETNEYKVIIKEVD